MFSANENILLRQHKRRVIEFVESTIPDTALDLGTSVMVMQVSCRQPGCVPLETAITVVFPRPPRKMKKKKRSAVAQEADNKDDASDEEEIPSFPKPLLPNLEESRIGGNYKTRILKPLSDVTQDDVLDALPPSFTGGRRTVESICIKARDMIFAQIGQLVGNGDDDTTTTNGGKNPSSSVEGRKLVAEYLKVCLEEYVERGCVPPEWGEKEGWGSVSNNSGATTEEKKDSDGENADNSVDTDKNVKKWGEGNIVFKRPTEDDYNDEKDAAESSKSSRRIAQAIARSTTNNNATPPTITSTETATTSSSQQLLEQITQSEHAPGIRRAGCPCCDPDGATTYVDKMMMGGLI